jgi:hypothetical protein
MWWRNLRVVGHLESLGVDGNTILQFIFKKEYGERLGGGGGVLEWIDVLKVRDVSSCCVYGNEHSSAI